VVQFLLIVPNSKIAESGDFDIPEENYPEFPSAFQLYPNYPNPFNPATNIRFDLPETIHVRLTVYDMLGREIARLADGILPAGEHQSKWDARSNPSGVYIIRLEAGA